MAFNLLFVVILNQSLLLKIAEFDKIKGYNTSDLISVTSFVNHDGMKRFFTSKDQALRIILNSQNLRLVKNDTTQLETIYEINGLTFKNYQTAVDYFDGKNV